MGFIIKLLARIPGLPGLGVLMNPWIWVFALSVIMSSFLFGVYLEHGRFEAHLENDKLIEQGYQFWAKQRNQRQARINKEVVDDLKTRLATLTRDNGNLLYSLQQHANKSILPPDGSALADGSGGSSEICLSRATFAEGLRGYFDRRAKRLAADSLKSGRAYAVIKACLEWDEKRHQLEIDTPPPQ